MLVEVWRSLRRVTASKVVLIAASAFLINQYCSKEHMSQMEGELNSSSGRIPSAFIPHGGGPMPILGDADHKHLVDWLKTFASTYLSKNKPTACLVISAHWEASKATVQSGDTNELYYDYYNFPKEAYSLTYPVTPAKSLSKRVVELLDKANFPYAVDSKRGYDHGVFIPMMLIYPDADIPTLQLSLVSGLDPELHIKIGEALAPLRDEGVFILGSGMSYHNMRGFRDTTDHSEDSEPFHQFLRETLADNSKSYEDKMQGLTDWDKAPKARQNHPREEHLIPLMCVAGSSISSAGKAKEVYFNKVVGVKCAGYVFE